MLVLFYGFQFSGFDILFLSVDVYMFVCIGVFDYVLVFDSQ